MKEYLTGEDLFSYLIILGVPGKSKRFILCEGDSDCAVLDPHLDDGVVETIPGYGKDSVIEAVQIAFDSGFTNVAALIDRDWGKSRRKPCDLAVPTDKYDIDATVFYAGDVCRRVVSAFCDRDRVREFLAAHGWSSPMEAVSALAFPLGVLRKLSYDEGWGIKVAGTPFDKVAQPDCNGVDLSALVVSAIERAGKPRISERDVPDVIGSVNRFMAQVEDISDYCCGHDLNSALSFLMRKKWSGKASKDLIERSMRGAFSCREMLGSRFFKGIHGVFGVPEGDLFTCAS
ncbi:hypothetical protein AB0957_14810 [Streptomyces zhihengii]|uniref:hypothetical protein n=1 Tax=Streptomyces zhihengii TaxID=1818004 RepID=UPI003451A8D7